ncbi:MAG: hypothetical protein ACRDM1_02150 [Gaiellaceae bacterium]
MQTPLITCRAAISFRLRPAEARGSRGLVVEMTDGTWRRMSRSGATLGFYYGLAKANVERIVKGLSAELAYGITDTDGSRPDCWGHPAAYGWEHDDGRGIDEFR